MLSLRQARRRAKQERIKPREFASAQFVVMFENIAARESYLLVVLQSLFGVVKSHKTENYHRRDFCRAVKR